MGADHPAPVLPAGDGTAARQHDKPTSTSSRYAMYGLLAGNQFANYFVRNSLSALVQVASKQLGMSDSEKAVLLAAHTPGYLLTQLPAGMLTQNWGAKRLLLINTTGAGLTLLAIPAAAKLGGPRALAAAIALMALFHGPFMPAQTEMKRNWLKAGSQRAWGTRLITLGGKMAAFATMVTPLLCASRLGWAGVHYVYGGGCLAFSALWQFAAIDKPRSDSSTTKAAADITANAEGGTSQKAVEWRIFTVPSAQVVVLMHIACNNLWTTLDKIAFSFFDEVLGCSAVTAGAWLAFPSAVQVIGNFGAAAIEAAMLSAGYSALQIRRLMTAVASAASAACVVVFGLARTPAAAATAYSAVLASTCLHGSGWSQSYMEVGGKDTAVLNGLGNTIANSPSFVVPFLALYLKRRTGSYLPICLVAAFFKLVAGSLYCRYIETTAARKALRTC
eukprot:SAG31_NODE_2584_length_5434_cov_3.784067_4_plen_447_part_00